MTPDLFIGMISGTSRDGADVVLADFATGRPDVLAARCVPYPEGLRRAIDAVVDGGRRPAQNSIRDLDDRLGRFFADIALELMRDEGVDPADLRGIGSHGQTVWHEPDGAEPISLQLGRGAVIAASTRVRTVSDFRSADLRAGGQGAPLAPLLHRELFASAGERRAVLNLGGIANLTLLEGAELVGGFDTGPANCLLDAWSAAQRGRPFDDGGAWAASGRLDEALLQRLLDEPYFAAPAPKSTGLERFNIAWLRQRLPRLATAADVQRTLVELTAGTVADALRRAGGADRVLVCGGGVHNRFLMTRLQALLAPVPLQSTAEYGAHPDWIEASLFAWLARERLAQRPVDTRAVTGARMPVLLGVVHDP